MSFRNQPKFAFILSRCIFHFSVFISDRKVTIKSINNTDNSCYPSHLILAVVYQVIVRTCSLIASCFPRFYLTKTDTITVQHQSSRSKARQAERCEREECGVNGINETHRKRIFYPLLFVKKKQRTWSQKR